MTQQPKKLLDQVRDAIRLKHYAYSTEKTYVYWAKRFVLYHNKRHPLEMGEKEISEFLTYLAVEENVAASTQNQALSALLFLYREVVRKDLDLPLELVWAERPKRLPTVLTKEEVQQVVAQLTGVHRLIVQLLYGSGLRLMERMRLRVKDLDFGQRQILVRDAKGGKDRVTILPNSLIKPLRVQLVMAKQLHEQDLVDGYGTVYLPYALERKYPHANKEWIWQGESLRHPHCAGTPRPQGRENHDGLYPRPQPGRVGRSQSLGLTDSRGLNLATHSFRHGVMDWQQQCIRRRRCDFLSTLFEVTPVQSAATGWTY